VLLIETYSDVEKIQTKGRIQGIPELPYLIEADFVGWRLAPPNPKPVPSTMVRACPEFVERGRL